ncbi:MAG: glycerol-3-phosphate 1-O-acyltransferase PlsY [Dehalococcoidia bacterium]|nr:glycerol-3-phosphate 1-O-acyltransferase PlsY [Dehalococcoidia bacterium]
MTSSMTIVFCGLVGYLLGSVQTGLIVGRVWRGIDVREYGSGKTGFTNTLRAIGPAAAAVVLVGDVLKGVVPVLLGEWLFVEPWAAAIGGAAAVVGHTWPVWAGFRGGRGVATAFGAFLAVSPLAAIVVVAAAGAILAATRYVSLMSVLGVAAGFVVLVGLVMMHREHTAYLVFGFAVFAAVELNHLGNIRRLIAGTEPKLGQGGGRRMPASR